MANRAAVRLVFSGVEAAQLRISNVLGGEPFRRLEEMRHGHIAHRRTKEAIGIRFAQTQAAAIVDEDTVWDLVEETVAIVSAFENVFGDCTDWIEQRAYYRRCGDALWANVVLNIKE